LPYDVATMAPTGVLPGDFNEDGRMDLLIFFWGRTPILFLRKQEPSGITEHSYTRSELTLSGERWFSCSALQSDLDGDGHIDLIIGNYHQDGSRILDYNARGIEQMHQGKAKALNGGHKHVFLWRGARAGDTPSVEFEERVDVFP